MNIRMRKGVWGILLGIAIVLCTIFSFSIIFIDGNKTSAKGGIVVEDGADVVINGGILQDNNQAISIEGGEHTISNVRISGSTNGAVIIAAGSIVTIENSIIEGNTNTKNGGAIFVGEGATLNIINTKISNNTTIGNGGAIYACANSVVQISENSLITENSGILGGGIYLEDGALMNGGTSGIEYFSNNTSTASSDIWQNVYYGKMNINFTFEGITDSNIIVNEIKVDDVNADLEIDVKELNDYYTWLPKKGASDSTIINFDEITGDCANNVSVFEGLSTVTYYGENKIKYVFISDGTYRAETARRAISGTVKIQNTYNGAPVQSVSQFSYCEKINEIIIPDNVTEIAYQAFANCTNLERITVGNGVTYISSNVFASCNNIKHVSIGNNVNDLYWISAYCSNIEEMHFNVINLPDYKESSYIFQRLGSVSKSVKLIIGKDVQRIPAYLFYSGNSASKAQITEVVFEDGAVCESIGKYAFYKITTLANLEIGDNVKTIEEYAFRDCSGLTNLTFGNSVETIGTYAFAYCSELANIELPDSVTSLANSVFYQCTGAQSIVIGNGLETISNSCFRGCSAATSLVMANSVTNIGSNAFYGCSSLTDVALSENLITIKNNAFTSCSKLQNITIPDSVITIEGSVFMSCKALENVDFGTSTQYLGSNLFQGCVALKNIEIPDSVTELGNYSFYDCTSLETVVIGDGLTIINSSMFYNCTGLLNATIGSGVETISTNAFYGCSNLLSVAFGDNLKTIGSSCFSNCKKLQNVVLPSGVTAIESSAFYNCTGLQSINLPSSITTLGSSFLYKCTGMTELYFNIKNDPDYTSNHSNYTALGTSSESLRVTFGKDVERVPAYIFYNVSSSSKPKITEVVFEEGSVCKSIGTKAFYSISSLQSVDFGGCLESVESEVFYNCKGLVNAILPDSLKSIGKETFAFCEMLQEIRIGKGVESIGEKAFLYCYDVEDFYFNSTKLPDFGDDNSTFANVGSHATNCRLVIGKDVERIPAQLFGYSGNGNLLVKECVFEEGSKCRIIGKSAFKRSQKLEKITFPNTIELVEEYAFSNCTKLAEVHIFDENKFAQINFESYESNPLNYAKKLYKNGEMITRLMLDNVINIANYAFYNANTLLSVTFSDNVKTVGSSAFYGCSAITEIHTADVAKFMQISFKSWSSNPLNYAYNLYENNVLVENLVCDAEDVGDYAFYGARCLTSVTFGNNVKNVGVSAFYKCSNITAVHCLDVGNFTQIDFGNSESNPMQYSGNLYVNGELLENLIVGNVTKIGDFAFYNAKCLKTITIGKDVENIGINPFVSCVNVTSVVVDEESSWYTSRDSIGQEVNSIIKIDGNELISGFTSSVIPDTTQVIQTYAFAKSYIVSVTIPHSVTAMYNNAFSSCSRLEEVHITDENKYVQIYFETSSANPVNYVRSIYKNGEPLEHLVIDNASSIGQYSFYYARSIKSLTISGDVSEIGQHAFVGCTSLTQVIIGDSVVNIGEQAFNGCSSLAELSLGGGVVNIGKSAFINCAIVNLIIPDSVEIIEDGAFFSCTKMEKISLGKNIKSIGNSSFSGEKLVTEVYYNIVNLDYLDTGLTHFINLGATSGAVKLIIGKDVEMLPAKLLYYANSSSSSTRPMVTEIVFEEGSQIETINDYAFYGASYLTTITFGENIKYIGNYALSSCSKFKDLILPEGIISVGQNAFSSCSGLTSVTLPSTLESINNSAFASCSALTAVHVSDVNHYAQIEFENVGANPLYNAKNLYINEELVTDLVLDTATHVGGYAFYNAKCLQSVIFGENIDTIGTQAFQSCTGIVNVIMGRNIKFIEGQAFSSCSALESVTMGDNVESIANNAFSSCSALTAVYISDVNKYAEINFAMQSSNPLYYAKNLYEDGELVTDLVFNTATQISSYAFINATCLQSVVIGCDINFIGYWAFYGCSNLTSVTFENEDGWFVSTNSTATSGTAVTVTDASQNATYITNDYKTYYWKRSA